MFSSLRASRGDSAQTIEKALLSNDFKGQEKLSKKCKSYSGEQVAAENVSLYNSSPNLTLGPKYRMSWLVQQLKKRNLPVSFDNSKAVNMFPSGVVFDDIAANIINVIGRQELGDINYSTWLINNSDFKEFAKASILGPAKEWFADVIKGEREYFVTSLCQKINLKLVQFMVESGKKIMELKEKKGKEKIPFHIKVLHLLQDHKLGGLLTNNQVLLTRAKELGL